VTVSTTRPASLAAFWAATALAHEGLDVYMTRETQGQYDDGGQSLIVNGLMVRVRPSDLSFSGVGDHRWDTVAFDTSRGFKEETHPQAYIVVSSGCNGFVVIPQSHYKVAEFHRRKQGSGFVSMAELARQHCWTLEQFYSWVRSRTEDYDPEALNARVDEIMWRHIVPPREPPLLDLVAAPCVLAPDDPRSSPDNCIACGRLKPPGNPAYCYDCHKLSRSYTAREAAGKPPPDLIADFRDTLTLRMSGYKPHEDDVSLLALVDRALGRKRTSKRKDGRYKDVLYDDEQELDL